MYLKILPNYSQTSLIRHPTVAVLLRRISRMSNYRKKSKYFSVPVPDFNGRIKVVSDYIVSG